jgi:hypothetical protein
MYIKKEKPKSRNCLHCGLEFTPKVKHDAKYCSSNCVSKFKNVEKYGKLEERKCLYCGELFMPKRRRDTKCCSSACLASQWSKDNKERVKENKKIAEQKRKLKDPKLFEEKSNNYKKNKAEVSKWRTIKNNFGLTKEQYFQMLDFQNNRCKICNNILILGKSTHIDHCHETGKVRGILCQKCNHGLGMFNDNIQLFYNAIQYLQQNK